MFATEVVFIVCASFKINTSPGVQCPERPEQKER